jgi:hypothetical protein
MVKSEKKDIPHYRGQCAPPCCEFYSLGLKYFLSALFSNTLIVWHILWARDHIKQQSLNQTKLYGF